MAQPTGDDESQWSMDRRTLLKRTGVAGVGIAGTASAIDRTKAEPSCGDQAFMIAYEELRPKRADWDYNDFTAEVRVAFDPGNNRVDLTVSPIAAVAELQSDLEIHLPESRIHSDGSYRVERRDVPTQTVTKIQHGHVSQNAGLSTRLVDTVGDAVTRRTPNACSTVRHELTLTIDFEKPFPNATACPWPLPTATEYGSHGSNLFFVPALRRLDTGNRVMPGDERFLLLPSTESDDRWARPLDGTHVADAYRSVSRKAGSGRPSFDQADWYLRKYADETRVSSC